MPDDDPVRWSADGKGLYIVRREGWKATLLRVEIASGRREVLREFQPSDPAGIRGFAELVRVAADGRSYVYSYNRIVGGQLFLAEGLR